jgi:C-terminal processing protease CtpA/Prc
MAPGFTGSGARVSRVSPGSLAERAGLLPGDVITSFNGNGVYGFQDILASMQNLPSGGAIEIIAWRNSESVPLIVDLSPDASAVAFDPNTTSASPPDERLAHMEALMRAIRADVENLKANSRNE